MKSALLRQLCTVEGEKGLHCIRAVYPDGPHLNVVIQPVNVAGNPIQGSAMKTRLVHELSLFGRKANW